MSLGFEFSSIALDDLADIYDFYTRVLNKEIAQARVDEIFHRVKEVCEFPNSGEAVPSKRKGVRKILQRDYLIFYVLRDNIIYVLRVQHGRRDLRDLEL
jgi:plasmid stabilization system protein ParE